MSEFNYYTRLSRQQVERERGRWHGRTQEYGNLPGMTNSWCSAYNPSFDYLKKKGKSEFGQYLYSRQYNLKVRYENWGLQAVVKLNMDYAQFALVTRDINKGRLFVYVYVVMGFRRAKQNCGG